MTRRHAVRPQPQPQRPDGGEPLPPARGWKRPYGGRSAYVDPGAQYQATTVQAAGLSPFTAGTGAPLAGTPVGRHQLTGEVVCLDAMTWLRENLITNPGMFILGQPGTGKSTFVKRQVTGAVARGDCALILGDPRPDYVPLTEHLGGQVIRVGRGADRLNPLDAGPLGRILPHLPATLAAQVRAEVRSRRLSLLIALCTLVRGEQLANAEEVILGAAIDLLDARLAATPVIPDVLKVLDEGPDEMRAAARADSRDEYRARAATLIFSLDLLLTGTLAGVFDTATTKPIDLNAPMVCVDLSRTAGAGTGDKLLTAAMLCTWANGFAVADAALLAAEASGTPGRSYLAVLDEMWRALRGAPGLVEHADMLTRLNRAKRMSSIFITHSLDDLDALATEEDRAKARGMIDRCAITVMSALPPHELQTVSQVTPLTGPERDLVASWSATATWQPGAGERHPGRGRYLIKCGGRQGIPVEMLLVEDELSLYDTDQAIRPQSGRIEASPRIGVL